MVQTSASDSVLAPRRRRMPAALRGRLETDVAEIRAEIAQLATKEELADTEERIKRHVDSCTADILEAIECRRDEKSPSA